MPVRPSSFFFIIWLLVLPVVVSCQSQATKGKSGSNFPQTSGPINDFEDLYTIEEELSLEKFVKDLEAEADIQIAVVTLDTTYTSREDFDQYTLYLANYWGVGEAGKNNGILIAISDGYRRIRIHNGYGIEKIISNEETKKVLEDFFIPYFKQGKFYEGIVAGTQQLVELLKTKQK